jgi:hypothetical protein
MTQDVIVAGAAIIATFHELQDPSDKPGDQEIDDTDPLWVAYLDLSP